MYDAYEKDIAVAHFFFRTPTVFQFTREVGRFRFGLHKDLMGFDQIGIISGPDDPARLHIADRRPPRPLHGVQRHLLRGGLLLVLVQAGQDQVRYNIIRNCHSNPSSAIYILQEHYYVPK